MSLRTLFDLLLYFTAGFYWSDQTRDDRPADAVDVLVFVFWPIYVAFMSVAVSVGMVSMWIRKDRDT